MSKRVWRRLSLEDRRAIYRLAASGLSGDKIAERVGRSRSLVEYVVRPVGGLLSGGEASDPVGHRLSMADRADIYSGLCQGLTFTEIADQIGFSVPTVSREVGGKAGRATYRPVDAHGAARRAARRCRETKLAANPQLCDRVIRDLEALLSPEQISARLRIDFPDDETMRVSHETIYQTIYVQGRGELRRELARCLRTGRAKRQPHSRVERRGRIPGMVSISQRPPEVEDRAVPGHWEGDLIIGTDNKSAMGTLVERMSRYVILIHLPGRHGAVELREAMVEAIKELPTQLFKTLTWDQGSEMTQHAQFAIDTGIDVYFCDPHSPWQRGSNENTNGLLRQYFPKSTDLGVHTKQDLQNAADSLNNRPRQTLGWQTPAEALAQILATTA